MRFYVYELIDPRTDSVFYVGKGQRERYAHHRKEALNGKHSRKCEQIRSIIRSGMEYAHRIVKRFSDEQEAFDFEIEHIAFYGLENLTNVLPGGGSVWQREQVAQKYSSARSKINYAATLNFAKNYGPSVIQGIVMAALGQKRFIGQTEITDIPQVTLGLLNKTIGLAKLADMLGDHTFDITCEGEALLSVKGDDVIKGVWDAKASAQQLRERVIEIACRKSIVEAR